MAADAGVRHDQGLRVPRRRVREALRRRRRPSNRTSAASTGAVDLDNADVIADGERGRAAVRHRRLQRPARRARPRAGRPGRLEPRRARTRPRWSPTRPSRRTTSRSSSSARARSTAARRRVQHRDRHRAHAPRLQGDDATFPSSRTSSTRSTTSTSSRTTPRCSCPSRALDGGDRPAPTSSPAGRRPSPSRDDPNTNFGIDPPRVPRDRRHAARHARARARPTRARRRRRPVPGDGLGAGRRAADRDAAAFDVLNLETGDFNADFTGSLIKADGPVVVFSGSEASDAPIFTTLADRRCCADHLENQSTRCAPPASRSRSPTTRAARRR